MSKYKFIKVKYIIPSILLTILIVIGICFLGQTLKASDIDYDNLEWTEDGFVNINDIKESDKSTKREVGSNKFFKLYIDEKTTIVTLYKGNSLIWSSADVSDGATDNGKSNINLAYYDKNGKENLLNSFKNSVNYFNITTGKEEQYYSLRYNKDEKYVDVLYQIGEFQPTLIPQKYNYEDFINKFIGNTIFFTSTQSEMLNSASYYEDLIEVYSKDDPTKVVKTNAGVQLKYKSSAVNGDGYCLNDDAAFYMLGLGKGISVKNYSSGLVYSDQSDKEGFYSDANKNSYWIIYNAVNSDGTLKLKLGVDYNTETKDGVNASPINMNPFLTNNNLKDFLNPTNYTGVILNHQDTFDYWDYYIMRNKYDDDIYLELANTNSTVLQKIYSYLYIGGYELDEEGTPVVDSEYSDYKVYTPKYMTLTDDKSVTLTSDKTVSGYDKIYRLKGTDIYFDYNGDGVITEDEKFIYGGFQAKDENGGYLYHHDENGNIISPVQMGMLSDDALEQDNKMGQAGNSQSMGFEMCLRFQLDYDLVNNLPIVNVTLIHDSISEGLGSKYTGKAKNFLYHDNLLSYVQICQYSTIDSMSQEGQIIIPDGCGGVINFNSDKSAQYTNAYPEKRIYGDDLAINTDTLKPESENIMLPMYGFIQTDKNILTTAIVDKGAAQTSISADYKRNPEGNGLLKYNYAYFKSYLRESLDVHLSKTKVFTKVCNQRYQGDIAYSYKILAFDNSKELSYVTVAKLYKDYLLEKYPELNNISDTTTVSVPTFTFVGAYSKKTYKFGTVFFADYSLTSFEEAKKIVKDLKDNGIENMNVEYTFWTQDIGDENIRSNQRPARVLGGAKGLTDLSKYLKECGIDFYPNYELETGIKYNYIAGKVRYNSKSIDGHYSFNASFDPATGSIDDDKGNGWLLSPVYYNSIANKFLKNYNKYNISGISLTSIGSTIASDYSKNHTVYSAGSALYQREVLKSLGKKNNLLLNAPYDYAFEFTKAAVNIPVKTTFYGSIDYSIPLYQLVVSGMFDYYSTPINFKNSSTIEWNLLKAIETGSNISYYLCAEDTSCLLDTGYTAYYNSYYINNKEDILYLNNELSSTGIYGGNLVNHKYLANNVVEVTYSNGTVIDINYNDVVYTDVNTGLSIKPNWYCIIKEGNK